MKLFSTSDEKQIADHGISLEKIENQLETFKEGIPFVNMISSAVIGNGIRRCTNQEKEDYISTFEARKEGFKLLKFVPASGAATRMFKELFKFLKEFHPHEESINAYVNRTNASMVSTFFIGMEKFPFYDEVMHSLKTKHADYNLLSDDIQKYYFVKEMLLENGLNYGGYPKGLLPFHKYTAETMTAFEEHLYEAALYATSNGEAYLHFTISEDHANKFDKEFDRIEKKVEKETGVSFIISFSYQKKSTDTIAVDMQDKPFRESDNTLLFRPAGHGALIENLNEQEGDVLFVKNIDNVVVARLRSEIAAYKKMLAGMLFDIQETAFSYRRALDKESVDEVLINEIKDFIAKELNVVVKPDFYKFKEVYQVAYLKEKLDRPIRICGMVKNEGEPGGGPFWIKDEDGNVSLQIIESAQMDVSNSKQRGILKTATHFNPVDLVCGVKNYVGEKYDLSKFTNPRQGFITEKTKNGKALKAMELPGLWNGGMANWNTVFVEVPLITFNPVKTVNDLLKPPHQVSK
ncbi:protein of unknown function [Zhouia amylolytica]|uniref:DUF4301 domain-containing protein n=1 Tax=Zhouia amylolytica TaxID=376730 RepID=A0A1I6SJF6_9FLAO|nr:DUF4301 family protein [Zhouia amylolytica]SFS77082.1 protein of unknown function [Zhouia amylolytica]